jgi:hypothetical protein
MQEEFRLTGNNGANNTNSVVRAILVQVNDVPLDASPKLITKLQKAASDFEKAMQDLIPKKEA